MRFRMAGWLVCAFVVACGGSSSPPAAGGGGSNGGGGNGGGQGGGGACTDTQSDPNNCGACGNPCAYTNAAALCTNGECKRGVCAPGYFDLDGDPANGCEATCLGSSCQVDGRQVELSAPPLPETGVVAGAFTNGGPVKPDDEVEAAALVTEVLGGSIPLVYHDPDLAGESFVSNGNALVQNWVGYGANFY